MQLLKQINLENVLFLDIETVPAYNDYNSLNDTEKYLWDKKAGTLKKPEGSDENLYERAGIYAEFGKIIVVCMGGFVKQNGTWQLGLISLSDDNEFNLLQKLAQLFKTRFASPRLLLCAHNGKEFDFPYIARRMLINGISVPAPFDMAGKKPWEVPHLDTMELWKFGDFKSYTSLELLAHVFKVPTPKSDIDGSKVREVYYTEKNLNRIARYCSLDVITLARIFQKMRGDEVIKDSDVFEINE